MKSKPVCLECTKEIEEDPVYESVCGHDECPTAVFHALCLMEHREKNERAVAFLNILISLLKEEE